MDLNVVQLTIHHHTVLHPAVLPSYMAVEGVLLPQVHSERHVALHLQCPVVRIQRSLQCFRQYGFVCDGDSGTALDEIVHGGGVRENQHLVGEVLFFGQGHQLAIHSGVGF